MKLEKSIKNLERNAQRAVINGVDMGNMAYFKHRLMVEKGKYPHQDVTAAAFRSLGEPTQLGTAKFFDVSLYALFEEECLTKKATPKKNEAFEAFMERYAELEARVEALENNTRPFYARLK